MSRIRSIHPGLWTDEEFVTLSAFARLLFIGLWNECDDKGTFEWKPLTLKMRIMPADNVDVAALLAEIEAIGAIKTYTADGKRFGAVRNFRKFQKPKTPNNIHPATAEILKFVGLSSETKAIEPDAFPPKEEAFPPKGEIVALMEDGGWRGGEEELETNVSCASGDALKPEHVVEIWNESAPRLGKPTVRTLTPARRDLLKNRISQYDLADFQNVFGKIERSAFLRGDNGWNGCTFDWVFKRANFQKILEGNYDQ
jgi:hypothetical protein